MRFGQRSDKRRTYNFIRDEVVDHRAEVKVKGVRRVLDGDIGPLILATASRLAVSGGSPRRYGR